MSSTEVMRVTWVVNVPSSRGEDFFPEQHHFVTPEEADAFRRKLGGDAGDIGPIVRIVEHGTQEFR